MGTNFSKWEIKCFFNRRQKICQKLKVMSVKSGASTTRSHTYAGVCVNFLQPPFLKRTHVWCLQATRGGRGNSPWLNIHHLQANILKSEFQGVNNHKSVRLVYHYAPRNHLRERGANSWLRMVRDQAEAKESSPRFLKTMAGHSQQILDTISTHSVLIFSSDIYIWTQNGWDKAKQSEQIAPNADTSICEKRAKGMSGNIAPRLWWAPRVSILGGNSKERRRYKRRLRLR